MSSTLPTLVRHDDLERAVKHRIEERTFQRIYGLEVEAVGDRIEIRGEAPSYYVKQLAIEAIVEELRALGAPDEITVDLKIAVKSRRLRRIHLWENSD